MASAGAEAEAGDVASPQAADADAGKASEAPEGAGFAAGEWVRFWSKTRSRWVNATVHGACRGPGGAVASYDLDLHVSVEPSLVRRPEEPNAPPGSCEFSDGMHVWYWSQTYSKWVDAHVKEVKRSAEGAIESYHLAARMNVDVARVKPTAAPSEEEKASAKRLVGGRLSLVGARPGRPSAASADGAAWPAAPVRRRLVGPGGAAPPGSDGPGLAGETAFMVGEELQYQSSTTMQWVQGVVQKSYERKGVVYYDLSCKRGARAEQLRRVPPVFRAGEQVEFWSTSASKWMAAQLLRVDSDKGRCDLDVKRGAPLSRLRKLPKAASEEAEDSVPALEAGGGDEAASAPVGGRMRRWRQWKAEERIPGPPSAEAAGGGEEGEGAIDGADVDDAAAGSRRKKEKKEKKEKGEKKEKKGKKEKKSRKGAPEAEGAELPPSNAWKRRRQTGGEDAAAAVSTGAPLTLSALSALVRPGSHSPCSPENSPPRQSGRGEWPPKEWAEEKRRRGGSHERRRRSGSRRRRR